jgi:protein-tyrosine-phosphatase
VNQPVFAPRFPHYLKLLAHEVRWQLLQLLAHSDYRVAELVSLTGSAAERGLVPSAFAARRAIFVREQRSAADGRDIYYSLNLPHLRRIYLESAHALHPALLDPIPAAAKSTTAAAPFRVLFLCTHNSARSQLAEGLLRKMGGELVEVYSAGNEPSAVHPLAIRAAAAFDVDISGQQSELLDAYVGQKFDFIITVCDRMREVCPTFPGDPHQIHWSFPDPAEVTGPEEARFAAFLQTARELNTRISYLYLMMQRQGKAA